MSKLVDVYIAFVILLDIFSLQKLCFEIYFPALIDQSIAILMGGKLTTMSSSKKTQKSQNLLMSTRQPFSLITKTKPQKLFRAVENSIVTILNNIVDNI